MELPYLDTPKVVGDPIHGYVPLTELEYDLIQLPSVVRLHRVRQTATAYLTFPGSLTSRFEHLIGALHIGYTIILQLLTSIQNKDELFKELFPKMQPSDVKTIVKSVRLACLFHDLGHGPFSHSSEDIMRDVTKTKGKEFEEAKKLFNEKNDKKVPIHEYYSYKLITNGEIKEMLNKDDPSLVDNVSSQLVKTEEITALKENPLGFSILRKIVSSQLDADRMDYLLRDGIMSGVKFGQVDISRVIRNMAIIKGKDKRIYLAINDRATGSIEDMLDARFKMYKWFYNHHTVVATNLLVEYAMQLMFQDKLDPNIFHWSSFEKGLSTDEYILSELTEKILSGNSDYLDYKGLIDRRYIPISLLKRPADYKTIVDKINEKSGRIESKSVVHNKIAAFFDDPNNTNRLSLNFESKGKPLDDTLVLADNMPRTPYNYIKPDDQVWLYRKNGDVAELTEDSPYFSQINIEWEHFPSIYLSYIIRGMTKNAAHAYEEQVYQIVASEIAAS